MSDKWVVRFKQENRYVYMSEKNGVTVEDPTTAAVRDELAQRFIIVELFGAASSAGVRARQLVSTAEAVPLDQAIKDYNTTRGW